MNFDFLFLPLKEKSCISYIDFWLLVSSRTLNLPSPASCPRRRRESSSSASTRPTGWFRALPFKPEKKKLTQRQTAADPYPHQTQGNVGISSTVTKHEARRTKQIPRCCFPRWPSHLLPAHHQLMYCQYSLACSHISVYNAAPEDVVVLCRVQRSGNASVNEAVC